jgi:hypothetical protein
VQPQVGQSRKLPGLPREGSRLRQTRFVPIDARSFCSTVSHEPGSYASFGDRKCASICLFVLLFFRWRPSSWRLLLGRSKRPERRAPQTRPRRLTAAICRCRRRLSRASSILTPPSRNRRGRCAWCRRKGAPNILLILTDDVGFGAPSTFGGVIPTPSLDRIAADGLRYTNMHSTSLCSPTRAALITGRNHHSVGFGVISEIATGFPGYNSVIGKDSATIGRILLDNGYRTAWFGKNHNTPVYQTSQAGPFDQWPTGMGFQHFYGFMGGDADQWTPGSLFRDTTHIEPFLGNPTWNLTTAMADDAIQWVNALNDINPEMPFLLYYAPGGTHSPHHPTPEWDKKISDMHLFDKGWNDVREQIFANQKRLGVIPQDAKLTPWPKNLLKKWDQLTPVEKKLFIRQADVYGAYLAYTDHEIGRVIQAVELRHRSKWPHARG